MKNLLRICIAGFIIADIICNDQCKVTTFDAICKRDDILYVLSAQPCTSKYTISVTLINMKNTTLYKQKTIARDSENPIPIFNHPGKGAVVVMDFLPASDDPKDYRKTKLHVMMYFVDIEKFKSDSKRDKLIMEAKFPMFTSKCMKKKSASLPIHHDSCHYAHKLGEFSSLCIVMRQSPVHNELVNKDAGIYIVFADMCTVPYSTRMIAFLFSGYVVDETYTQDKTDELVSVSSSRSKCGLFLIMHGHYGDYTHVKLQYSCSDSHYNITLINTFFSTHNGMICPLSTCVNTLPDKPLQKFCTVPWKSGKDQTFEAHIDVELHICTSPYSLWWNIHLKKSPFQPHEYPFEERELLKSGRVKNFRISHPKLMHEAVSSTNGYMFLGWGKISLFTTGKDLAYVSVLHHYPSDNDTIPLFRTEFWLQDINKLKVCPPKDTSLATGLTIAGIGILVFIVIVVVMYRRRTRWRKTKGVGLPYQIHLAEEITQDIEMDDEA